jgi:hypothetical protein
MKFPHLDLGSCYLCDQYEAKKEKAVWMADGYIPTCDECFGAINAVTSDLHAMGWEIDGSLMELDRARVELRQMIAKVHESKEEQS